MAHDLFLTDGERAIFDGLSDALKEGWNVQTEKPGGEERPDELYMRFKIAHFTDPACKALAAAVQGAKSAKEFETAAAGFNPSKLSQEQIAELFFVLGTRVTSAIVTFLLKVAKDDEDLEGIAAITAIRRMLKEANSLS